MVHILKSIFNTLFPPPAPVTHIELENSTGFLRFFSPHIFLETIALSTYGTSHVQAAITANKFHHNRHGALLLASLLEHWLNTLPKNNYVLIPVPLSAARLRERGHNQVTTVVRLAATNDLLTINETILHRQRNTKAQSHLGRTDRLSNLAEAFACSYDPTLAAATFILVDDVITTGSTLKVAKAALRAAYPASTIICVALAH